MYLPSDSIIVITLSFHTYESNTDNWSQLVIRKKNYKGKYLKPGILHLPASSNVDDTATGNHRLSKFFSQVRN